MSRAMRGLSRFALAAAPLLASGVAAQEASGEATVERLVLAQASPFNASGETLHLIRYVIPPGARLPRHIHEGTQIGWIDSGVLTYHVVEGDVPVGHTLDSITSPEEVVSAGGRVRLGPGEWLVETPDDVHFGTNEGNEPVVLYSTALLHEGAPLATVIEP